MVTKMRMDLKNIIIFFFMASLIVSCKSAGESSQENKETKPPKAEEHTETKNEGDEEVVYNNMAKELCDCMDELFTALENMKTAPPEEQKILVEKVKQIPTQIRECTNQLRPKYPDVNFSADSPQAEKAMIENCPKYAKMKNGK